MKNLFIVALFTLLFSVACKTTSKIQAGEEPVKQSVPSLKRENVRALAAKLKANQLNYKWISARASVEVDHDSTSDSFTANIRMRKDSVIWISVSKLDFRGAQILLTQDSVMLINYRQDNYFKEDFDSVNDRLNNDIDFDMLQSVMMGGSMEFYNDTSKMKSYFDGKQYIISTIRKRRLKRILYRNKSYHSKDDGQFIFLDPTDFHIAHIRVEDFVNKRTFDVYYSDFQKVDSVMFPFHIQLQIKAEKTFKADIQYKKVLFKTQEETPFIIPKKYERVRY